MVYMTKGARYAYLKTIKIKWKISHLLQYTLDQNFGKQIYVGFHKHVIK